MVCLLCIASLSPECTGADRARQYGAMDFISSGADARPKIGTDGLPEGFDMKYARQKYEAGVVTGRFSGGWKYRSEVLTFLSYF